MTEQYKQNITKVFDRAKNPIKDRVAPLSDLAINYITKINEYTIDYKTGVIDSLLIVNNAVRATIKKAYSPEVDPLTGWQVDEGFGYFNIPLGMPIEDYLIEEVFIPTDIPAFNTNLDQYKGAPCTVKIVDGFAVEAKVNLNLKFLTVFPIYYILTLRKNNKEGELFTEKNIAKMKSDGYTEEDIADLKKFVVKEEMLGGKTATVEGEAVWFKQNSKQVEEEVIVPFSSIWRGLNRRGMKSKDCHIPSSFFTGK